MIANLLLAKRLFQEACRFAEGNDPVSCGLSISLLQDAAEMLIWALVKAKGLPAKDQSSFTANLELLQKNDVSIPEAPRLLELNKARVGFKHYGNLPAATEAHKFQTYVEDFLRTATQEHLGKDFDRLSLVDLVPYPDVQARLKTAEAHVDQSRFTEAVREASIAKVELFAKLDRYIPQVDHHLGDVDRLLARSQDWRGAEPFRYIEKFLTALRELSLVTLLRLSLNDYAFLCGRRAIVNARIAHREHADQSIVNGKIGIVNARIGHREQQDRSS
jgi:hypothetical protein